MKVVVTFNCNDGEKMERIVDIDDNDSHTSVTQAIEKAIGLVKEGTLQVRPIREGSVAGVVDIAKWLKEKNEI